MQLLIFDLDGTLIDSKLDLAHSVNATRAFMGMDPLEYDRVYSYVGNGAPVLIRRALGDQATDQQVQTALAFFLQYYRDHKLDYTQLYPGVRETLDRMCDAGLTLAILTNKPEAISLAIVDGLGLRDHFVRVYGGNSFEEKKPHPIGIQTLMRDFGIPPEQTLMVGDSAVDIRTARNAGVRSCGVTYGFQPETLLADPPDLRIDGFQDLGDWVLPLRRP
ncbi:MAG: HAD family hydrolase [Bryobacteraceae bacterium]